MPELNILNLFELRSGLCVVATGVVVVSIGVPLPSEVDDVVCTTDVVDENDVVDADFLINGSLFLPLNVFSSILLPAFNLL